MREFEAGGPSRLFHLGKYVWVQWGSREYPCWNLSSSYYSFRLVIDVGSALCCSHSCLSCVERIVLQQTVRICRIMRRIGQTDCRVFEKICDLDSQIVRVLWNSYGLPSLIAKFLRKCHDSTRSLQECFGNVYVLD